MHHNSRKTHCPRGHEYTADNIYYTTTGARRCKTCEAARAKKWPQEKKRIVASNWRKNNPEKNRNAIFKRKYGMRPNEYRERCEAQNHKCGICDTPHTYGTLVVDHDHHTNRVRGLLCHNCNRGLGMFKDNVRSLVNAAQYLLY